MINCLVNDIPVRFEVDTGSHLSTISLSDLSKIKNVSIRPTSKIAKGYSNNVIQFRGEVALKLKYGANEFLCTISNC